MKINKPVTDREVPLTEGEVLVSKTDPKGVITYANRAFIKISGFGEAELIGSNHNIIRHPDMPVEAFADLWRTVKSGKPWTGLVKNRCKDGDFYWVKATVSPMLKEGKVVEYMSVRVKPSREEIVAAEQLYRRINAGKASLDKTPLQRLTFSLASLPIRFKLAGAFTLLMGLIAVGLILIEQYGVAENLRTAERDRLQGHYQAMQDSLDSEYRLAAAMAALVAEMPSVQEAFATGDSDRLTHQFKTGFDRLKGEFGVNQFQFHRPPATSFLRVHKLEKRGDDLSAVRPTIVKTNAERIPVRGLDIGPFGLGLRGLTPVYHLGRHIGSVEFGMAFGKQFFDDFKAHRGVDISLELFKDGRLENFATTLTQPPEVSPEHAERVRAGEQVSIEAEIEGKPVTLLRAPVRDYAHQVVGLVQVVHDRSALVDKLGEARNRGLLTALLALLAVVVASLLVARSITRPLSQAVRVSGAIATGQYDNEIAVRGEDEVGQLLMAMKVMQSRLNYDFYRVQESLQENLRVRTALDRATTNMMMADQDHTIIYLNKAMHGMFSEAAADIRQQLPHFDADNLLGQNIDVFHRDPSHQRRMLESMNSTTTSQIEVGRRTLQIIATPVFGPQGERLGTAVEWADLTDQLAAEREVDAIIASARQGDLARRIDVTAMQGFYRTLGQGVNELLGVVEDVFDNIASVMKTLSQGDLTQPIVADYQGSYGQVKESVNQTIDKLASIVSELLQNAEAIATAADQINAGNTNLSQRTEQQAASLEETAASLEEITSTVRNNADNAQQANQVAANARQLAEKGGEVVGSAVLAMEAINASSAKIAEIIGVIDEIAFQTNLLALNASVEAARAGDQGRGFAVVATEVRNLASRSAAAAKEIKELIQDSVEKVRGGSELVNESGATLQEIVGGVKQVGDIIAEIAAASAEQSAGIDQVNQAVTAMDEVTQQNAALAEQTSAASASMTEKAREMDELMTFFSVEGRN